jgi:leucyl-tRNA synthetase
LGHEPSVALAQFADVENDLLVEQKGIAIVQIDGKLRDKFEVDVAISEDELRELALNSEPVKRTLQGKEIANVIVRAPKLVNIATK